MKREDAKFAYAPVFVDLVENKSKSNSTKARLVLYYLSSYFLKFSKKDIRDNFHHSLFYWNENDELILSLNFECFDEFCDESSGNSFHGNFIQDGSHDDIFLLYNFMTKKIAVQGFLVNKKNNIGPFDTCVIEDIKKFSSNDFERISSCKLIDYHNRDEQLDEALTDIEHTFPINSFWEYNKESWSSVKKLGCVTSIERDDRYSVLHITRYSLEKEKLDMDVDVFRIFFQDKDEFLKEYKFENIDVSKMQRRIFKTRKNKVADMKKEIEGLKSRISMYEKSIESIRTEIEKKTLEADAASEEIKNLNVKSIKLL